MKSSVSRKDLKNLVKECVREVMFEEGMISDLVSEIAAGFAKANLLEVRQPSSAALTEKVIKAKPSPKVERQAYTENKKNLTEVLKKNFGGVDLFEGTTPAPAGTSKSNGQSVLAGVASNDSGVDISAIPGMNNWKHLIK
jgi:hypothetical protein